MRRPRRRPKARRSSARVWGLTSRFAYGSFGTQISRLVVDDESLEIRRLIGEEVDLRRAGGLVRFQRFRLPLKWCTDVTFVNNGEIQRVHFRTRRSGKLATELRERGWRTEVLPAVTIGVLVRQVRRVVSSILSRGGAMRRGGGQGR